MAFDPATLFANGEVGLIYEIRDISTLFQDAEGAIPVTADGQPVGKILDKSGNGYHATQSVASKRPTYRDVDGVQWIEFDGIDDFLQFPNHPFTFTGGITVLSAFSKIGSFNIYETLFAAGTTGNRDANREKSMAFQIGNNIILGNNRPHLATDIWTPSGVKGSTTIIAESDLVASWNTPNWSTHRTQGNIKIRLDGADETVSPYNNDDPVSLNSGPAYIGVFDNSVLASSLFQGKIYGLIVRGITSTAQEVTDTEEYLTALTVPAVEPDPIVDIIVQNNGTIYLQAGVSTIQLNAGVNSIKLNPGSSSIYLH